MGELGKSALTSYDGGAPIREGFMEKELDYRRRFWFNWLEISIRVRRSEGGILSYTECLFQPVQERR